MRGVRHFVKTREVYGSVGKIPSKPTSIAFSLLVKHRLT